MSAPQSDEALARETGALSWEGKISVDVIAAGLAEFYRSRSFEATSEVVARIYLAMKYAEDHPRK